MSFFPGTLEMPARTPWSENPSGRSPLANGSGFKGLPSPSGRTPSVPIFFPAGRAPFGLRQTALGEKRLLARLKKEIPPTLRTRQPAIAFRRSAEQFLDKSQQAHLFTLRRCRAPFLYVDALDRPKGPSVSYFNPSASSKPKSRFMFCTA
jgi:hypothetical protein